MRADTLIGGASIGRQRHCAAVVGTNILLLFGTTGLGFLQVR
jgi:hypothetical protein